MQFLTWVVPMELGISRIPVKKDDLKMLKAMGARCIVCLATEWEIAPYWGGIYSYEHAVIDEGMEFYFLPVEPGGAPNTRDMVNLLDWISSRAAKGRPSVVHCFAGVGRAATVAAGYLIFSRGMTANAAIEYMRRIKPGAIETYIQEETLMTLSAFLTSILAGQIPIEIALNPPERRRRGIMDRLRGIFRR